MAVGLLETVKATVVATKPFWTSPLFAALVNVALSAPIATFFSLRAYRHQARELLDGATTWQTVETFEGREELPYLALQNRSAVPAYIIKSRFRRGVFIRTETKSYAFDYEDPDDGDYPLEVKAQSVTSFPLSRDAAVDAKDKASLMSKILAYLLKRPYVWVEIVTISGRRVMIPANEIIPWYQRPMWLNRRWIPEPKPDWLRLEQKMKSPPDSA